MCISLHKEMEDATSCSYRFTTTKYRILDEKRNAEASGSVSGVLKLSKLDGSIKLTEPMPGDTERRVAVRAAQKIARHWSNGELPENTMHAAG
jgi:hypothetical protein